MPASEVCVGHRYVIECVEGEGKQGTVYLARDRKDPNRRRVAVKWPTTEDEVRVLEALHCRAPRCLGVPRIFMHGRYGGHRYVVMELLGEPIERVFCCLKVHNILDRWSALSVLGRMLIRRLRTIHAAGFLHCDINPENILMGRADCSDVPFFVDFGSARPFPGGEPMDGVWGSVLYNSIRSARGGPRTPGDDLEALGWVLCRGLFGDLPWSGWADGCDWSGAQDREKRWDILYRIRDAKSALLDRGHSVFGHSWAHLADMPWELRELMRRCRESAAEAFSPPDYDALEQLLGAERGCSLQEAERRDVLEWLEFSSVMIERHGHAV